MEGPALLPDETLRAYVRHANGAADTFAAWDEVTQHVRRQPVEDAWLVVQRLVDLTETDAELAFVAAGAFEDFLKRVPEEEATAIAELIWRHAKLRRALSGVWVGRSANPAMSDALKRVVERRASIGRAKRT